VVTLVVSFIIACFLFDHFVQFRKSDKQLMKLFADHHVPGSIHYYTGGSRPLRYVTIGSDTLPTLFMIHGAPSSLSIYERYFTDTTFLRRFRMVAVDRPGYGYSSFGDPEPSIARQSDMLWPILQPLRNGKPLLIVGGSYGSSVACRLVMDHPGCADGLMLIAPSLAPGEEKMYWFTYIVENPLVNWFIPRMFQSANTEKIHHREGLTKMLPYWKSIDIPVTYLQGEKDRLIYTSNADFAGKMLVNSPRLDISFLKNRPHFFVFTEYPAIRSRILELYDYVLANK
jgi:pimeloyl-ACP methyl ester carboxylesterase